MKKLLWLVFILLIGFIGLIYFSVSSTDKEFETVTIQEVDDLENIDFRRHDSIEVAPVACIKRMNLRISCRVTITAKPGLAR